MTPSIPAVLDDTFLKVLPALPCDPDTLFRRILADTPPALLDAMGIGEADSPERSLDRLLAKSYGTVADVSSDPNANVGSGTMASVCQEFSKGGMKMESLRTIHRMACDFWGCDEAERLVRLILTGAVYPSDLHLFFMPYCYNLSASVLMHLGLPFIPRTPSRPAKHADTFVQHVTQLIMYAGNHQSGACALTGFFVAFSWYARKDGLSDRQCMQLFQNFLYTINQPVRLSAQTPFLNLSFFDRPYLESLYGNFQYPDGTTPDLDHVDKMQKLFAKMFFDEIRETGTVFTFPVLTVCLLLNEKDGSVRDEEFLKWATEINEAFGLMNFYVSKKASSIATCCRLNNELDGFEDDELDLGYMNSFGAGGDGIGSVGVVTVNLPQAAWTALRNGKAFHEVLKERTEDAGRICLLRRRWVEQNTRKGLLPLYDHGFISLSRQYCTVGFCGMFEAAEALGVVREESVTADLRGYEDFAASAMGVMNETNRVSGAKWKVPFNLEQVPAEGQAVQLARKDREQGYPVRSPLYSNQWIPLSVEAPLFSRIRLAGRLDPLASGGAILHLTTEGKADAEVQRKLIRRCAEKGVVYFAFNYVLSRCESCSCVTPGDVKVCGECGGADFERYTRVVGFVTPVKHWSKTRREEFGRRCRYQV